MTFTIPVNVRNLTVENTSVYLYWVTYTQDGVYKFCTSINHTENNTNLDSANFGCAADIGTIGAGAGAEYTTTEEEEKIEEEITEKKKGIKEHISDNLLLYLIIFLVIVFLILKSRGKKEQTNLDV